MFESQCFIYIFYDYAKHTYKLHNKIGYIQNANIKQNIKRFLLKRFRWPKT